MGPSRAKAGTAAVAGVLGAVTLLWLMTWAATVGPDEVLHRPGLARHSESIRGGAAFAADGNGRHAPPAPRAATATPPGWLRAVADVLYVVLAALAAVLLWWLAARALRAWRARRTRPRRTTEQVAFETLAHRPAPVAELAAAAGLALADLDHGTPRNAIVACWHRLETTAEQAGVRRRRWQTSSEFVLEVLDRADADAEAVARLAELYREARFSDHELGEAARGSARAALHAARRSLTRTGAPSQHGAAVW